MGHRVIVVVAGGGPVPPSTAAALPQGAPVVAADGGLDVARSLGLRVDVAVGDFDSATPEGLAAVEAAGGRVERHPTDKDATDLALALDVAARMLGEEGGEVVVVGTDGGRLDHLLAGVLALADLAHAGRTVRAHIGAATVHVVHGPGEVRVDAPEGSLLSVVPVGGDATGVRTSGLRYPLHGETLASGTTRGVSNVIAAGSGATVGLEVGTLLVVVPGDIETGGTP